MDKHLNIFKYFNNNDTDLYEDNLSRAFAICLKYDTVFLDQVLKTALNSDNVYQDLFGAEYPDYSIKIDLQRRPSDLGEYSKIIAIACSGSKVDFSNIEKISSRSTDEPETDEPETDVCIEINDICLIFEFKRTSENCASQLKSQAEKLSKGSENVIIEYVDLNWKAIIKILQNVLSLQKQINTENIFTNDFLSFLENSHPEWFPHKPFKNIPFFENRKDRNYYYLNSRLNEIKNQLAKKLGESTSQLKGSYSRLIVSVSWGWANEVIINPEQSNEGKFLSLSIYIGDTKAQGINLFQKDTKALKWPPKVCSFPLSTRPYLKFSHFNSGQAWYDPNEIEYLTTHTYKFFRQFAGRYKKAKWEQFDRDLSKVIPNWKSDSNFTDKFENSNRTYFDLSIGTKLTVNIPYEDIQELDKTTKNTSSVVNLLSEITKQLKSVIDESTK